MISRIYLGNRIADCRMQTDIHKVPSIKISFAKNTTYVKMQKNSVKSTNVPLVRVFNAKKGDQKEAKWA